MVKVYAGLQVDGFHQSNRQDKTSGKRGNIMAEKLEVKQAAKAVNAYQDGFSMSQEAFGALDGIQANWVQLDNGNINCTLVVAGNAATFAVPFDVLCKNSRPYIRGIIRANKEILKGSIKAATAGRGSTKPVLAAVKVEKASNQ